ncbi:MAG: aldo/keto reductase [Thermoanaerobaculia bacterium]
MQSTELGHTGTEISILGFGAMWLSIQGRPDRDQAIRTLNAALDEGATLLDTADAYCLDENDMGHNERLIAAVLRHRPDLHRIKVATKGGVIRPGGNWRTDASPAHLREACEASLRALGVEEIFLYQLHAPDASVPFDQSVETLGELQREQKIRHIGLSNVSLAQLQRARELVDVQSVQNRFNPFDRDGQSEIIAECGSNGITFLAYSPLGGKRLARGLSDFPLFQNLAEKYAVSPWAVALAWDRAQGERVIPIPGSSTPEHTAVFSQAAKFALDPADVAAITENGTERMG